MSSWLPSPFVEGASAGASEDFTPSLSGPRRKVSGLGWKHVSGVSSKGAWRPERIPFRLRHAQL